MSNFTPYQPPASYNAPVGPQCDAPTPAVYYWYVAYCIALALLYVVCVAGGVFLMVAGSTLSDNPEDQVGLPVMGVIVAVLCIPLGIFFAVAPFLPRKKWAWIYGIVAIAIGLTSGCTIVPAILLLVFWLQDPAKRYFNV